MDNHSCKRKNTRILVVDDEELIRKMLVDTLSSDGVVIDSACNVEEAISMVSRSRPDMLITDVCLGRSNGLDLLDHFRDIPAVVISGYMDGGEIANISRDAPVEFMSKPLDINRLKNAIHDEARYRPVQDSGVTAKISLLADGCGEIARKFREVSDQLGTSRTVIQYQQALLEAACDDEVFSCFFQTYTRHCGSVFGIVLVCDSRMNLKVGGRFGVPMPDGLNFCRRLSGPVCNIALGNPGIQIVHPSENANMFSTQIAKYLPGISVLAIPLVLPPAKLIGMILLYKKGEQPFERSEMELARNLAQPTAVTVQRINSEN